jgi:endonuclease/exonuclease/phosphatase family metal-dependent hydrolase
MGEKNIAPSESKFSRRVNRLVAGFFVITVAALFGMQAFSSMTHGGPEIKLDIATHQPSPVRPSDSTIRVMTLNLAHGRLNSFNQMFVNKKKFDENLQSVASVLSREQPDVVALQEADKPSFWSGRIDHVKKIASAAGFYASAHGEHVKGLDLAYGTALMTNLNLSDALSVTFPPSFPTPSKGFIVSTIELAENIEIDVVSVHLDFARHSVRTQQVEVIKSVLKNRNRPIILMGDLNSQWDDKDSPVRALSTALNLQAWKQGNSGFDTYPPFGLQLDWVLVSSELSYQSCRVVPDAISDHRAVVCDIQVNKS